VVDHDHLDRDLMGLQAKAQRAKCLLECGEQRRLPVISAAKIRIAGGPAEFEVVDAGESRFVDHSFP
jgi:hypothetical protein